MTEKYLIRRHHSYVADDIEDSWGPSRSTIDVLVETDEPIETGLLDADGNKLFRVRERIPIGFHRQ